MKIKRKNIIILIFTLIVTVMFISEPLRLPPSLTRSSVLKIIPVGTDMNSTVEFIENNTEWEIWKPIKGKNSIYVTIGEYQAITNVIVTASFRFCENGKLVDVKIEKHYDSL